MPFFNFSLKITMDQFTRTFLLMTILFCRNIIISHCQRGDDLVNFYESHDREKRQIPPGMGGESCLQIYSVPRKSVVCEPSQEVENKLTNFKEKLEKNTLAFEELKSKVEYLDPEKPKELPQEVKDKLETIDEVKMNQVAHFEHLKRLEGDINQHTGMHKINVIIQFQRILVSVTQYV